MHSIFKTLSTFTKTYYVGM